MNSYMKNRPKILKERMPASLIYWLGGLTILFIVLLSGCKMGRISRMEYYQNV